MDLQKKDNIRAKAELVSEAVEERVHHLFLIEQQLSRIDGQACTGREYWRDQDHPTRDPKLYLNHQKDEACPLHGKPDPGKRLRVYIGSDPEAIQEARRALALEDWRQELLSRKRKLERGLTSAEYYARKIVRSLSYHIRGGELLTSWTPENMEPQS